MLRYSVIFSMVVLCLSSFAVEKEKKKKTELPKEETKVTHHVVKIGGEKVEYTATAGTINIDTELSRRGSKKKANIFYMAYTRKGQKLGERPITFSFNGGPGSSSVWLHLGLFGPRRVVMGPEGHPTPPPYKLVDNEYSLLDKTDLVFIDPVSTGYSRAENEKKARDFHGLEADIHAVGEFIRLYVSREKRWGSPKFLAGESYGTTRASGLVQHLQNRHGMNFNGVMLISSIIQFQTARFDEGNDLPYILFLPTYTATAFYHGKLDPSLGKELRPILDQVEEFALGEYGTALLKGDRLSDEEKGAVADKLSHFTGIDKEFILNSQLRLNIHQFCKELYRDEQRTVGRLDSRFKGIDRDSVGERNSYDPSYAAILGTYTATMNAYVREELGYESDRVYEILTGKTWPWDYSSFEGRYVEVAERLRDAMSRNRDLKVYVANGYYDLATPYFATEHTFNHMMLDPELRDNVTMKYYPSGHMMYIQYESLKNQKQHLVEFLDSAIQK